ncbi:MAG: TadE family protein [Pseudodesulfovibrio sp.]|uniref:TadE family protein n=1 Tax=Pseudodesulfovibrio sp. TaxID=2035812 RepID=UPI003D0990D8
MQKTDKRRQGRRGLAAVEMAMLLPIFLLLLMGVMDVARLFWTQGVVRDAAFEGARIAILNEATTAQIETEIARKLLRGGLDQAPSIEIGPREPSRPVDVTVSVPFEFLVIGSMVPQMADETQVAATAVMTHER